jgi:2-oxo-hept-3-ene-1,7-dioate hydratase
MRAHVFVVSLAAALAASTVVAHAASCGPVDHVAAFLKSWETRQPAASPGEGLGADEALCVQRALVARLRSSEGRPVGWKVGLTSPQVQQALGVSSPVVGRLLSGMILQGGATLRPGYAARPIVEADMIAIVGDAAVNAARSPAEVAGSLRALHPFIELPGLVVAEGQKLTGPVITAINVGARRGVIGQPIAMRADEGFVAALASMRVTLSDDQGKELSAAPGAAILGHPLNAVIFLADELRRRGESLKPGDMISLGSFGRPAAPAAGRVFTARYDGLPTGPASVSVRFR